MRYNKVCRLGFLPGNDRFCERRALALDYEQLLITNEMSEIIRWHNQCLDRLRSYRETYPYLMAPNVARMMEENLKENVQMLYRELNNLHKPKQEQRRHVCRECHSVFAVSLPGGICDECRARQRPQEPVQYQPRPVTTGSESESEDDLERLEEADE